MGSTQVESKKEEVCGMYEQKCTAKREYMKITHGGGCVGCWLLAAAVAMTGGRMATTWKVFAFSTPATTNQPTNYPIIVPLQIFFGPVGLLKSGDRQ